MLVRYYKTVFQNTESGFSVMLYLPCETIVDYDGNSIDLLKAVGYFLPQNPNIDFDLIGHWEKSKKYGTNFVVETFKEVVKPTREGIIKYLSCGQIKGIGAKTAEKIYDKFGDDTLNVLDSDPNQLLSVQGISKKKLEKIVSSYIESRGARDIITLLAPHGISAKRCVQFYKKYGEEAIDVVKHHPYRMCEMAGIGFQICDKVAQAVGVDRNSIERIEAGFIYTLMQNELCGNTCMEKHNFIDVAKNNVLRTSLSVYDLATVAGQMCYKQKLISNGKFVYRPRIYNTEVTLGTLIGSTKNRKTPMCKDLESAIQNQEQKMGITFADEQKNAIKGALSSNFSVITGGPGTGKSTIIKGILDIFHEQFPKYEILCCAPTGRAARRMTECTKYPARTIHSAIRLTLAEDEFFSEEEHTHTTLDADLIVVDEVSMVDVFVANALFDAIKPSCKVVFVGDADQLPSVGAGSVLSDIIVSERVPVVKLDTVFRQEEDSLVAINAQKIRHLDTHLTYGDDFKFVSSDDLRVSSRMLINQYLEAVKKYGIDNVALLSPFRKRTETGVNELNVAIREIINPEADGKKQITRGKGILRVGDKVINTKNGEDVANGDIGYIEDIICTDDETTVVVDFKDGRIIPYDGTELDKLDLAYATTIHKSQGSEYASVIINIQNCHYKMLSRPLIYTAITRSKKEVTIVGEKKSLAISIKKNDVEQRCTGLAEFIQTQVQTQIK